MPRRVANYAHTLEVSNFASTIGAYVLMAGMLLELYVIVVSWRRGKPAGRNPWHAKSLEWQVPTPVPLFNFDVLPVVTSDPYGYGEPPPPAAEPEPGPQVPVEEPELVPAGAGTPEGEDR
jgi:cytochrome c oxidase subunit 1